MDALFGSFWEEIFMITIRVLDANGRPVAHATVTIESTYHQESMTALTNHEGIVKINLHPNEYDFSLVASCSKEAILVVLVILFFVDVYC
jgi:bacterial group 1 Ig-like protein